MRYSPLTEVSEVRNGVSYSYVLQDSPYLAASENLQEALFSEAGIGVEGPRYLINAEALPPETKVIPSKDVSQSARDLAVADPTRSSQVEKYLANQPLEQEALIKGSVPGEAITPVFEARVSLQATVEASAGMRILYRAAEVSARLAKIAGQAATVYGAHTLALRNAREFGGSPNVYVGTFLGGVLLAASMTQWPRRQCTLRLHR